MSAERQNLHKRMRNIFFSLYIREQTMTVSIHGCPLYSEREKEIKSMIQQLPNRVPEILVMILL